MAQVFRLYWELLGWLCCEPNQNHLLGTVPQLKFSSNSLRSVNLSDLISNVLNVVSDQHLHKMCVLCLLRLQAHWVVHTQSYACYFRPGGGHLMQECANMSENVAGRVPPLPARELSSACWWGGGSERLHPHSAMCLQFHNCWLSWLHSQPAPDATEPSVQR